VSRRPRGPAINGRVRVLAAKCDTCIFRPGNLMRLQPGRREQMVTDSLRNQSAIICHDTLSGPDPRAVCRGFFDVHGHDSFPLKLAGRLGCIDYITPPTD
jgi:hypothetical protein